MRVTLMSDVKNYFIFGKIEYIMQGNSNFHHSEVGRKVPAVLHYRADNFFAKLFAQRAQLLNRHRFELCAVNIFKHLVSL